MGPWVVGLMLLTQHDRTECAWKGGTERRRRTGGALGGADAADPRGPHRVCVEGRGEQEAANRWGLGWGR